MTGGAEDGGGGPGGQFSVVAWRDVLTTCFTETVAERSDGENRPIFAILPEPFAGTCLGAHPEMSPAALGPERHSPATP